MLVEGYRGLVRSCIKDFCMRLQLQKGEQIQVEIVFLRLVKFYLPIQFSNWKWVAMGNVSDATQTEIDVAEPFNHGNISN